MGAGHDSNSFYNSNSQISANQLSACEQLFLL